ncbi:MAG: nuclear transport factor 2 family protein [Ginsengibacter sp.]
MEKEYKDILVRAYQLFNSRNIDALLSLMDENVHWPNGWEGGYVEGHDEVKNYWTRQWKEITPNVKPISFKKNENGKIEVGVHQLIKDMQGNILLDGFVKHIYTIEDGLIKSMEIEE